MIRVLFMGRKKVASNALEYLLSLENIQVVGVLTDSHLEISPTTDVARHFSLPLFEFSEALAAMKSGTLDFDLGLSVLYWRILRDEFLTIPEHGIINFHPAPLPEYKGTAGYNMAIMDEHSKWAATAHYIDTGIDTGGIIKVSWFDIDSETETAQSLERMSQPVLLELFKQIVTRAIENEEVLPSTPNIGGRYITRKEMEAMKEVMEGDDVCRKIRAFWFPPYDGAYKYVNGVKCTLVNDFILNQIADPAISSLFTKKVN